MEIVRAEVDTRMAAADEYETIGQTREADSLNTFVVLD
jgi:hypothetical protein